MNTGRTPRPAVSVIVATRDRADALRRLLASLESMAGGTETDWELILVDNGSSDATAQVAREAAERATIPLRCLLESRRGKSRALNAGLAHAAGPIVAFTDDDCLVAPDWVDAIAAEFAASPTLGGLGGRVELYDATEIAVGSRTFTERIPLRSRDQLFYLIVGCNMAYRRSVLAEVGGFDERLGPGAPIPAAEDVDLVYRAFRAGHRLEYTPAVRLRHHHGRHDPVEREAITRAYVIGRGGFYCKHILRADLSILVMALDEVMELMHLQLSRRARGEYDPGLRLHHLAQGFATHLRLVAHGRRLRAHPG